MFTFLRCKRKVIATPLTNTSAGIIPICVMSIFITGLPSTLTPKDEYVAPYPVKTPSSTCRSIQKKIKKFL